MSYHVDPNGHADFAKRRTPINGARIEDRWLRERSDTKSLRSPRYAQRTMGEGDDYWIPPRPTGSFERRSPAGFQLGDALSWGVILALALLLGRGAFIIVGALAGAY